MIQFTKGPWKYNKVTGEHAVEQYVIKSEPRHITVAHAYYSEANANLIAAAPDLLAALEELRDGMVILSNSNKDHKGIKQDIAIANVAIAKAKGES